MSVSARRRREKAERRQAILEAAAAVFDRKGFAQATMDEIAAEAELSKGTLYLYFKNKDDLFFELSAGVLGEAVERFRAIAAGDASAVDKVRAMLLTYADKARAHPDHFRTVVVFLSSGHQVDISTPSFAAHRERVGALALSLADTFAQGQRDGTLRADVDPRATVVQLWGGMLGVIQLYLNRDEIARRMPHPIDSDNFITGYVDLLIDGLRPR